LNDEVPRGVYVVESGLVKTYTISPNGAERMISIDGRDAQVPIGYAMGIIEKSQYFYEAYSRCRIRVVPRDDYNLHLRTNIESLYNRHLRMTTMLISVLGRVHALEQPHAGDKVARTLLYMADRATGAMMGPQAEGTKLNTTQQEIANLLGLSRETTNVELKKLELKKLISHSRKNYVLYVQKIRNYIENKD